MQLTESLEIGGAAGAALGAFLLFLRHGSKPLLSIVAREVVPPEGLDTHGHLKPEILHNGHPRLWDRIDSIDERLAGMDARFRGIDERMANAERDRQLLVQGTNDTNSMVRKLLGRRRVDRDLDKTNGDST